MIDTIKTSPGFSPSFSPSITDKAWSEAPEQPPAGKALVSQHEIAARADALARDLMDIETALTGGVPSDARAAAQGIQPCGGFIGALLDAQRSATFGLDLAEGAVQRIKGSLGIA
ncbi:MAG: hypothetical protein E7K72_27270 [Roseomonas mucosa]|nr:hypothetical protein [Roseomonas mucosa]